MLSLLSSLEEGEDEEDDDDDSWPEMQLVQRCYHVMKSFFHALLAAAKVEEIPLGRELVSHRFVKEKVGFQPREVKLRFELISELKWPIEADDCVFLTLEQRCLLALIANEKVEAFSFVGSLFLFSLQGFCHSPCDTPVWSRLGMLFEDGGDIKGLFETSSVLSGAQGSVCWFLLVEDLSNDLRWFFLSRMVLPCLGLKDDNGGGEGDFSLLWTALTGGPGTFSMEGSVEGHVLDCVPVDSLPKGPAVHAKLTTCGTHGAHHVHQGRVGLSPFMKSIFEFAVGKDFCLFPPIIHCFPGKDVWNECPSDTYYSRTSRDEKASYMDSFSADFKGRESSMGCIEDLPKDSLSAFQFRKGGGKGLMSVPFIALHIMGNDSFNDYPTGIQAMVFPRQKAIHAPKVWDAVTTFLKVQRVSKRVTFWTHHPICLKGAYVMLLWRNCPLDILTHAPFLISKEGEFFHGPADIISKKAWAPRQGEMCPSYGSPCMKHVIHLTHQGADLFSFHYVSIVMTKIPDIVRQGIFPRHEKGGLFWVPRFCKGPTGYNPMDNVLLKDFMVSSYHKHGKVDIFSGFQGAFCEKVASLLLKVQSCCSLADLVKQGDNDLAGLDFQPFGAKKFSNFWLPHFQMGPSLDLRSMAVIQ